MKHLTLCLALAFISVTSVNACHLEPAGYCGDQSFFTIRDANPHSTHYIIDLLTMDTLMVTTTGAVATDSVINLPMYPGVKVLLRFKYTASNKFDAYAQIAVSANYQYANCGTLAVAITNVTAERN